MTDHVAPDGSPGAVYLALPPGEAPRLVAEATPPGGSVLELGSGPGRHTRPLVAAGFRVVAVDESAEMLAYLSGAEAVVGDVYALDLRRTFDTVLAASNLICAPDPARRQALLDVCRRHVAARGCVLLERYEPAWAADPPPSTAQAGPVGVAFEPLEVGDGWFRGRVTYRLGDRAWVQEFVGSGIEDEELSSAAERAGLRFDAWLDERRTWGRMLPADS